MSISQSRVSSADTCLHPAIKFQKSLTIIRSIVGFKGVALLSRHYPLFLRRQNQAPTHAVLIRKRVDEILLESNKSKSRRLDNLPLPLLATVELTSVPQPRACIGAFCSAKVRDINSLLLSACTRVPNLAPCCGPFHETIAPPLPNLGTLEG